MKEVDIFLIYLYVLEWFCSVFLKLYLNNYIIFINVGRYFIFVYWRLYLVK